MSITYATVYVTEDGQQFKTEQAAEEHQATLDDAKEITSFIDQTGPWPRGQATRIDNILTAFMEWKRDQAGTPAADILF
jgi:hypothetical protein